MKKLILLSVAVVILIIGTIITITVLNQKTVQFDFDDTGYSVEVINTSDDVIKSLAQSGSIKLEEGTYSYRVVGDGFDSTPVEFTVNSSFTISVASKLTNDRLSQLLEQEITPIREVILANYSSKSEFTFDSVTLLERGDWAVVPLDVDIPQQAPNTYRTVLHKENGSWKVKIPPTIAINKNDYKDIPESVINNIYRF